MPAPKIARRGRLPGRSRRVSTGELDIDELPRLTKLRRAAFWTMTVCGLSFILQLVLLSNGFYEGLLS